MSPVTVSVRADATRQQRIANGFSRAAERYDGEAQLQREVADALLEALPLSALTATAPAPLDVLDLGCGTGYAISQLIRRFGGRQNEIEGIGLDLAPGMIASACQRHGDLPVRWLVGEAERLPLADASRDLIVSSLALQWCDSLDKALGEAARVLRPGGWLAFTTLGDESLSELRDAWLRADGTVPVNRFLTPSELEAELDVNGLRCRRLSWATHRTWHADARSALRALQRIGANTLTTRPVSAGLAGRARMARRLQALEAHRVAAGIPTRYRVASVLMQRLSPGE
ncbi:methyltransferase domain-containing protein [Salinicola avicenniae]|uniref:methyltransferase domain-containing protein n=1 Tax=Salinicola avicenniae TaxID=2916836 RepID=UPI00207427D2|nr:MULTISPECIES: methyltransferase domain-containing protein [unclassified Salinicola]